MRSTSIFLAALACALLAAAGAARETLALDRGAWSMEILVDGRPVREYASGGTLYIEALRGREYSVRLRNRTSERIAIALSVDGLNSIDAKATTAFEATKWILDPWETITLDGWQTSSATARRFFFTTERDSYGAWLGKTQNLGVITAAVFRERRPAPIVGWLGRGGAPGADAGDGRSSAAPGPVPAPRKESASEAPGDASSAPPSLAETARNEPAAGSEVAPQFRQDPDRRKEAKARLSDELAATGIGRELDHRVRRIAFDEEDAPAAVLEVRYEYRDALVRLGVLNPCLEPGDPLARRERAHGFEDMGFAPDPYRRDRR